MWYGRTETRHKGQVNAGSRRAVNGLQPREVGLDTLYPCAVSTAASRTGMLIENYILDRERPQLTVLYCALMVRLAYAHCVLGEIPIPALVFSATGCRDAEVTPAGNGD